jgi:FkbM family methyltransferase
VVWLRRAVRFARRNFSDEIVLCPNGDVWNRDNAGPEFLVPVDLAHFMQVRASAWETHESALLAANSGNKSPVMLDVGANIGLHSIRLAWALRSARAYAFEPVAENYRVLCRNVSRNRLESRVEPIHSAVGAADGTVSISPRYGTGNWVGATDAGLLEPVPVVSIDSFLAQRRIRRVDLVKVDVEGYELHVLLGAQLCLAEMRSRLLVEISEEWTSRLGYDASEVFALLGSFEYDYLRLADGRALLPPSGTVEADLHSSSNFLFFPRETPPALA